jgi:hypothetical protein
MMISENLGMQPFLARYEVEILEEPETSGIAYDDALMILLINGKPAYSTPSLNLPSGTKHTLVHRETTDDD